MLSAEDIEEAHKDADALFENDVTAILQEAVAQSDYSPMVGMALPIHKLILMNNVFAQGGGIQRVTAVAPSFTISMERRFLVTPQGEYIDMFLDQNRIGDAIDDTVPTKTYELKLPQLEGATDIFGDLGGAVGLDELSTVTRVVGFFVPNVYFAEGDHLPVDGWYSNKGPIATAADAGTKDVWFHLDGQFTPYYGGPNRNERVLNVPITLKYKKNATETDVLKDTLMGTMNNNKIALTSMANKITKVMLAAKLNSANAMREVASVAWKVDTDYVEIPEATPINTTVSPEEVKDIAAMYDANQVTKIMSITKTALSEYKDKKIKRFLDESYARLDERTSFAGQFDFAVPEGYALDWVTFRHSTFMDYLDDFVTKMFQVLNDPNMTVTIYGDPSIVRKVTPKEYTYQAPAQIGPVTLDYTQTVVNTSDNRVYNFIGSDKMRGTNELMVIINPRNTERFVYRIYDYQLYISNEIRNASNPALPAIHSFERFLVKEYQPVQGRIDILNPSGLRG
ncbi:MAG: hypothetical protein IKR19_08730 [Acholeplasmatales bacterium]|nr:hypothetical protein [Acholeplasmatales bacterium]